MSLKRLKAFVFSSDAVLSSPCKLNTRYIYCVLAGYVTLMLCLSLGEECVIISASCGQYKYYKNKNYKKKKGFFCLHLFLVSHFKKQIITHFTYRKTIEKLFFQPLQFKSHLVHGSPERSNSSLAPQGFHRLTLTGIVCQVPLQL